MMNSATIHKTDAHALLVKSEVFLTDCMEFMKTCKDNQFDLAVVDPPYGIGMDGGNVGYKGFNNFEKKNWDKEIPSNQYFEELFRVSKNQVIFGLKSLKFD